MRRMISITAFALVLAVPLWAQRGGGHGGGGHASFGGGHVGFSGHGGFAGGHGGFSGGHAGGGHFSGRMHGGFSHGFNRPSRTGFSRGPFLHNGFHNGFRNGFNRRHRDRFRFGLRTNNCFGFACRNWGFPWWGWGYDPWLWDWWDDHSSYDDDYYQDLAIANQMNQQSLEQQRMMRQEESDRDQDIYSQSRSASRSAPNSETNAPDPVLPATVLVFHDQHRQEIRNYAIVGETLWNFAPQHTQKIPLADLDLAATEKANDDRGITFRVPSSGEAQ